MKQLTYFLIIVLSIQLNLEAQNLPIRESDYLKLDQKKEVDPVEGSTYLAKVFKPLIIKTTDNKVGKFTSGNYNIKKGRFFAKTSKGTFRVEDALVSEIVFLGYRFRKIEDQYYALLSEGEATILKKYELSIQSGPRDPLSKAKIKPDKYVVKEAFCILDKNKKIKKIKLKKKSILDLFSKDKESLIKKYMKDNKLSYRKEKDLQRLFNYLNEL